MGEKRIISDAGAQSRDGEKRRKAKRESRERLEGEEEASYVRREGRRREKKKLRGRGCEDREEEGSPGEVSVETIDLSIQRSSNVLSLSSLVHPPHQQGRGVPGCHSHVLA